MKNLPNKITIVRICLLPLVIFFYLCAITEVFGPWAKLIAFILFAIATITDFLDGLIARKFNLVSDFGKFLDPIADKLLATTGLVLLLVDNIIPLVLGIVFIFVMLLRDYIVTGLRQLGQLKGVIIAADKVAKIKANVLYFTLIVGMFLSYIYVLPSTTSDFIKTSQFILNALCGLTTLLIAISGIVYIINNAHIFTDKKISTESEKNDTIENDKTKNDELVTSKPKIVKKEIK